MVATGRPVAFLHMPKTVILGAARTPFGKMGGALASQDATDLGGTATTEEVAAAVVRHCQQTLGAEVPAT